MDPRWAPSYPIFLSNQVSVEYKPRDGDSVHGYGRYLPTVQIIPVIPGNWATATGSARVGKCGGGQSTQAHVALVVEVETVAWTERRVIVDTDSSYYEARANTKPKA